MHVLMKKQESLKALQQKSRNNMKKEKGVKYIDDGRTIANMNVDGMPWYNPSKPEKNEKDERYQPTRGESLYIIFGVLKAAMLVALIFVVVFLAFILFAENIWLK